MRSLWKTTAMVLGMVAMFGTMPVQAEGLAIEQLSLADQTTSAILVTSDAGGSTGNLSMYQKENGVWTQILSTEAYLGRNGVTSEKSEGDGCTPNGVYSLGQAFGIKADPGCTRNYLQLTDAYYWVDDSNSAYYNKLVNSSETGIAWNSAEHLSGISPQYDYVVAINYNTDCVPGAGSAIFLHTSDGTTTSGCIAVAESDMINILQCLRDDTMIQIR